LVYKAILCSANNVDHTNDDAVLNSRDWQIKMNIHLSLHEPAVKVYFPMGFEVIIRIFGTGLRIFETVIKMERLGRPRHRWVDNIKMDLRENGWDGMDWIDLAQDRDQWRALVNTVMNLRVPQNAGKFSSSCTIGSFSRRAQLHE
jgi:hypothetical protein